MPMHKQKSNLFINSKDIEKMRKIDILTSIKGHNSVQKLGKISCVSHNTVC